MLKLLLIDSDSHCYPVLEIPDGTKGDENPEIFCFSGYVQAVFVAFEDVPSEDTVSRTQSLKAFFNDTACRIFYYKDFFVFLFEDTPEITIRNLLENLCGYLMKSKGWFGITLGSRCQTESSSPGAGIRKTCGEAEWLMDKFFFYSEKKILCLEDIQDAGNIILDFDAYEESKKLCSYIQVVDHKKIKAFFGNIKDIFFHSGKSPREIRLECLTLMIEIRGELVRKFPALKKTPGIGRETFSAIMDSGYLDLIIDIMTETCLRISESLPLLSADSSFQRIISYVKNNYSENLRLETLGQLFYYNCAYLGKRFKKYTGKSFHAYLDTLRIDAAKEMLMNTGMKVYEISSTVGYANTDYFYSKFKKITGKSPISFRRNEKENPFLK